MLELNKNKMKKKYENKEEKIRDKERKILIVVDDMIVDMLSNKKFVLLVTELFIRGRKLKVSLVFITQSYFAEPKSIRLNSTNYFIMEISSKKEIQQIVFNYSSDIDYEDFMNLYKNAMQNHIIFW